MRRQRSGLLVHVSSGAGRVTIPALAAYCASTYALEAITDAYRYELLPFGVDSILVEPGVYRTGIHDRWIYPADAARIADTAAPLNSRNASMVSSKPLSARRTRREAVRSSMPSSL